MSLNSVNSKFTFRNNDDLNLIKKRYRRPILEEIIIETEEVIAASGDLEDSDNEASPKTKAIYQMSWKNNALEE